MKLLISYTPTKSWNPITKNEVILKMRAAGLPEPTLREDVPQTSDWSCICKLPDGEVIVRMMD